MLVIFAAAIVLSLLALFRLRHGWIAEEAKRKVGWYRAIALLALNLFAPIGLYALALGLTDGGRRDVGLLMLVPGWLFVSRPGADGPRARRGQLCSRSSRCAAPAKCRSSSALAMLSVAFLIGETRGNERSLFALLSGLAS